MAKEPLIDPRRCIEHPEARSRKQRPVQADAIYNEVRYACDECGLWWCIAQATDDAWGEIDRLRKAVAK